MFGEIALALRAIYNVLFDYSSVLGNVSFVALSIYAVFFGYLFALPFIPGAMDFLTNNPNGYRPDNQDEANKLEYTAATFGFFTDMQQGRVKIVVSMGGQFVKALMDYSGHLFAGEKPESRNDLSPRNPGYWKVVETRKALGERDSHPIPFPRLTRSTWWYRSIYYPHSLLWWLWKRYVYFLTGKVFVGIYPFRKIRTDGMRRTLVIRLQNPKPGELGIQLVQKNDYTDHYRVGRFQFAVFVPNVNCQDTIPVSVVVNFIGRVDNPWLTAFETDGDWPTRLFGSISDAVTAFGRTHPVSEVLTTKGEGADKGAGKLSQLIARIGKPKEEYETHEAQDDKDKPKFGDYTFDGSASAFGIHTAPDAFPQIIDVSLLSGKDLEKLAAPAFALAQEKADEHLATGQAAYTREIGKALKEHPQAESISLAEAYKGVAAAAGDKAILHINLGGGSSSNDSALEAILKILKDKS